MRMRGSHKLGKSLPLCPIITSLPYNTVDIVISQLTPLAYTELPSISLVAPNYEWISIGYPDILLKSVTRNI